MNKQELNTLIERWEQIYIKIESLPGYPNPDKSSIPYRRLKEEHGRVRREMSKFSKVEIETVARERREAARKALDEYFKRP